MTTAIAAYQPNVPAVVETDPENFVVPGMEDVRPDELRIPILRLIQAQSRVDEAQEHLGEWHNSVTGEFQRNPELLVVGVSKGRIMFPRTYNAENKPLCASDDGLAPRPEYVGNDIRLIGQDEIGEPIVIRNTIPAKCDGCPFAQWGDNHEPPACNAVAIFAGVDQEGMPVLLQIKSTGMKNVPSLKTLVAANGIRKAIKVGAVKEQNDTGTYYVPTFTVGAKPAKDWQKTAMRIASLGNLAARNQRAVMEADENGQSRPAELGEADDFEPEGPSQEDEFPF